jgi:RHS repeat-associated protein
MRLTEPANGVDDLYFMHGDQSGSTVLITDDTGQEVGRAHYEPFGETFSSTIPMTLTERLFSGQVLDSSTGLYYYGNGRYYDSSIGRYITPDPYLDAPFSSQRLDRYNFGFNNPLRYKRSEALPGFTFDSAKGVLVADAVSPASLTASFSDSLAAAAMTWLRGGATAGKLGYTGFDRVRQAVDLWRGGFQTEIKGVYPGPRGLPRVIVRGTQALKAKLGLKTHLTHAGIDYGSYVTRMARPSALGEFAWALKAPEFWAINMALSVGLNVLDYGWGSKADVGIGSTEFYAAVTVDLGIGVAGVGAGAVSGWVFCALVSSLVPGAGPAALVIGYVVGQVVFAVGFQPEWREDAVGAVTWFYSQSTAREAKIVRQGSPLLS